MFSVTEAEATAIRTTLEQESELSAGIELRRLFPGITDGVRAREMADDCGVEHATFAVAAAEPAQRLSSPVGSK